MEFDYSPPHIAFRSDLRAIEVALSRVTGVRDTVVSNDLDAGRAIAQIIRVSGINELHTESFAFQVMVDCKVTTVGGSCVVDVSAKFGHYPNDAEIAREAAESFQAIVVKLQKMLTSQG